MEDAAILSLVVSFSLILFAVGGWAMWRTLGSILEPLGGYLFVEIP